MLRQIVDVVEPRDEAHNPWMPTIDGVFIDIAAYIYARYPYEFALIDRWLTGLNVNTPEVTYNTMTFGEVPILLSPDLWTRLHPDVPYTVLPTGQYLIPRQAIPSHA